MDTHRNNEVRGKDVDNTYAYSPKDFPTAQEFDRSGITKIIYLNEADLEGKKASSSLIGFVQDLKLSAKEWMEKGIEIVCTGISPCNNSDNDNPRKTMDIIMIPLKIDQFKHESLGDYSKIKIDFLPHKE